MPNELEVASRPNKTKAASGLFLTQIIAAIVNLPVTIMLARSLGPDSYGEYQLLNRIALITVSLVCLGYPHAIAWAANKSTTVQEDRSIIRLLITVSTVGGLLCALAGVVLYELRLHPGGSTAWLAFGMFPLFNLFSANLINFFRGKLDAFGIAAIKMTQALSWLIICLILVTSQSLSVTTAAIAMLSSQVISAIIGLFTINARKLLRGNRESTDIRGITSFSVRVYPGLAIRDLNVYLDQIVIAVFLSTRDLGLYAVAVSLTTSLALLSGPVINTVQPIIQSVKEDARPSAIARAYAATLIVIGLPALVLTAIAPWIAPMLYGAQFSSSATLIQILCAAALLDSLNSCAHGALLGMNKPGRSSWSSAFGLVTSIALWAVLIPMLGTTGAALTSIATYLVVQFFMFTSLRNVLGIKSGPLLVMICAAIPSTFVLIARHAFTLFRTAIATRRQPGESKNKANIK